MPDEPIQSSDATTEEKKSGTIGGGSKGTASYRTVASDPDPMDTEAEDASQGGGGE